MLRVESNIMENEGIYTHNIYLGEKLIDTVKNYADTMTIEDYVFKCGVKSSKTLLQHLGKSKIVRKIRKNNKIEGMVYLDGEDTGLNIKGVKNVYISTEMFDNKFIKTNFILPAMWSKIQKGYILFDKGKNKAEDIYINLPIEYKDRIAETKALDSLIQILFK